MTPIFSKCFEKLIRDYICSVLPASLDPLQFAYRSNRSTDDAIAPIRLHPLRIVINIIIYSQYIIAYMWRQGGLVGSVVASQIKGFHIFREFDTL